LHLDCPAVVEVELDNPIADIPNVRNQPVSDIQYHRPKFSKMNDCNGAPAISVQPRLLPLSISNCLPDT
jgi:hypothetical protein